MHLTLAPIGVCTKGSRVGVGGGPRELKANLFNIGGGVGHAKSVWEMY
jgi:hypothetical protein